MLDGFGVDYCVLDQGGACVMAVTGFMLLSVILGFSLFWLIDKIQEKREESKEND